MMPLTVAYDAVSKIIKLREADNRMAVARDWAERKWEMFNRYEVSVLHNE